MDVFLSAKETLEWTTRFVAVYALIDAAEKLTFSSRAYWNYITHTALIKIIQPIFVVNS